MKYPFFHQLGLKDCGPACLKMVAAYYGRNYSLDYLRERSHIVKTGVSLLGISEAAESIGLRSIGARTDIDKLKDVARSHPSILHWDKNHFVVLYAYRKPLIGQPYFLVADPGKEMSRMSEAQLGKHWFAVDEQAQSPAGSNEAHRSNYATAEGYALVLEPTPQFFEAPEELEEKRLDFNYLRHYFIPYRKFFVQLALGMLIGSLITLISPVLTQALIDKGVNLRSMNMVTLVLIGQLAVFAGGLMVDLIRSRILLHIGSRMNITMVSDFFYKLFNLGIPFFDSHVTGDLIQRINDHKRLESLLTIGSLSTLFGVLNMFILLFVLGSYQVEVLAVYLISAALGFVWTYLFLAKRRRIDYRMFNLSSRESSKMIEMLENVQDLKISNSAKQKRWEWEEIQASVYKQKVSNLVVGQLQSTGSSTMNQLTNILISFICARSVINGDLSLGGMFAVNMIVGQVNVPLQQLYGFINSVQQARIGLDRIGDVILKKDETDTGVELVTDIPEASDIRIDKLSFNYGSDRLEPVLKDISLSIPAGKVTAIVGTSGSGKTTLLKLFLKFYDPQEGNMYLGGLHFRSLHHGHWRERCGVVMQDGKLFSGTIADNIAAGQPKYTDRIIKAGRIANIDQFINSLPMGYITEVGSDGTQVSAGQKQRILLARAVYKDPSYLFLDEATSALDANNEKEVMENLDRFFEQRTVVVIAHRLSTVKNADQILVMENGRVVESGDHTSLIREKGRYFELVKNQLEVDGSSE